MSIGDESSTEAAVRELRTPAVLQVVPRLDMGGVERATVDIAAAVTRQGWTAVVASSGGTLVHELERAGAIHVTLPVHSKRPWEMLRNVRRLAGVIDRHDVAIVHARSRAPAWSAEWAARRRGRVFVTTFHGAYDANIPAKRWYNAVMTRGSRVIAISNFIAEHVRTAYAVSPERIVTIPRGVNVRYFDPQAVSAERMVQLAGQWRLPDGMPIVLMPGRLTRWKGQLVLIDAIARLGRSEIFCVLVGSDQGRRAYRRELEADIRRRRLEGAVRIFDQCHDLPAAYMLADVVISASTDPEAFGRVAAEAQAMGRPVVATDHGGARETVLADRTGWLVPPSDAAALAKAIDQALSLTQAGRAQIAAAARRHILEHFTVEAMCAHTLQVYRDLLAHR